MFGFSKINQRANTSAKKRWHNANSVRRAARRFRRGWSSRMQPDGSFIHVFIPPKFGK